MTKTKKSSKGLALVLAAVLALTPMAGFPITALATGEAAAPKAEAPATDAADAPATEAGDTPQADAPATDADTNTDAVPGATPSTPAPDGETPQAEAPATDAATNLDIADSVTNPPATNAVAPTPTVDPAAATGVVIDATNFPDEKFREYVQRSFDKEKDGKKDGILDTDEIKAAKTIYVQWQGITTLKGLEHFTALTSLSCYYNPLTTLDISANTALSSLQCFGDSLTTLDLSHNPALVYLDCAYNNLTTLDVSKNTALDTLRCENNKLTTLDVSKNTALDTLRCENNKLTTLDLTGLNKLSEDSWSRSFSPQAPQIPVVKRGTQYELDIEALAKGQTLTAITLDGVPVTDLKTYDKMRKTAPKALQYTCATSAVGKSGQTMEVKANCVLYHPATLVTDANGTLTFDGTSPMANELVLLDGSNPTFTITPKPGYRVATLTVNGEDAKGNLVGETLALPAVTDAVVIAVTFEEIPAVNITASTDDNGTIDPEGIVEVTKGDDQTFTFTPNTGSELASVLVDDVEVPSDQLKGNTYTFTNVTAPHTIVATFKKIPPAPIVNFYSVTPTVENGTITPEHPTTVREGNSLKYAFSPKEGYALESVSVNGKAVEATEDSTTTAKTYSYTINSIYSDTTIHVVFKAVEPPVDPVDPVDPPKPPVDPTDPVDPPKPPVNPADPINPPTPPAVPDNGGNNNGGNNGGGTTIVERTNTVTVPAAPQAAALVTPEAPATPAAAAAKTEAAPAQATADTATTQGQLENPALGAQGFDTQHSHIPLALLLLAVWLVGGFAVIRQRKHTHDAIEGASY